MKSTIFGVILTTILVQVIFGFPIGSIISSFPTMPTWLIFFITVLGIPAICYFVFIKFLNTEVSEGQSQNLIQRNKNSIAIGVILGSIMTGFSSLRSLDCDLIIDNGTDMTVKVEYYNRTKDLSAVEIPSGSFKEITLPVGESTLVVNGNNKNIKIGSRGKKYIYNVDGVNYYVLTEVNYGSDAGFPEEIQKFDSTEFFSVYADYLFEAPASIITKRGSSKKKIVLYRLK